jgi:hypothetical protein
MSVLLQLDENSMTRCRGHALRLAGLVKPRCDLVGLFGRRQSRKYRRLAGAPSPLPQ